MNPQAQPGQILRQRRFVRVPGKKHVLEEERQRKELEKQIVLAPRAKVVPHTAGTGRQKKSRGTGFHYDKKDQPIITEQQRDADRLNAEWEKQLASFRRQERRVRADLRKIHAVCLKAGTLAEARGHFAAELRLARKDRNSRRTLDIIAAGIREQPDVVEAGIQECAAFLLRQIGEAQNSETLNGIRDKSIKNADAIYVHCFKERHVPWAAPPSGLDCPPFTPTERRHFIRAASQADEWIRAAIERIEVRKDGATNETAEQEQAQRANILLAKR